MRFTIPEVTVGSLVDYSYEIEEFNCGNDRYQRVRQHAYKYLGLFYPGTNFLSNIAILIMLAAGGYFVYLGEIDIGVFIMYSLFVAEFLGPLKVLLRFVEMYQQGAAGIRRFFEILDTEPEVKDRERAIDLDNVNGQVEFKDVGFSYDEGNKVLHKINLKVKKGETVAIVGPSGAGKSTLCNLIPRFYDIQEGSICIDDFDVRDVSMKTLRQNIGLVQQDVFLFSGTVKENIAYGRLDATFEEIEAAAKAANAHEFINELPNKYNTLIGEKGIKLSGGQKQRLSIARVFLKNPPILILDEATSSLDNTSEAIIQKSIEKLAENRTTFVIAHRLATIRQAKRIIVLTDNGIEEEGTHEQLINNKGVYYDLYNAHFESLLVG